MERAWAVYSDDEIDAALQHPDLHVRPPEHPVPAAMKGTALADIYARLARWNEGERHAELRGLVNAIIAGWDIERISTLAREAASSLPARDAGAFVVANMVGLERPVEALPFIRDFAGAIAGGASDDAIARGVAATPRLLEFLPPNGDLDERANRLGFLFQTYAATAALIEGRLKGRAVTPVPFTRRWASRDLDFCGARVARGDELVVLLTSPRFNFGAGRHACPGQHVASAIVSAICG